MYTYSEKVVHRDGHFKSGMIRCFHDNRVRNEIRSEHKTNTDESTLLLGLAS